MSTDRPGGPGGVYLDHAASSPLLPEALEAMLPYLSGGGANPSGSHRPGRAARRALDEAREELAELVGCRPGEVVFTSGGTESDNLAVRGALDARPGPLVVSAIEHHAVLRPAQCGELRLAGVDAEGRVDLSSLEGRLDADVVLVSVMAANNETGVVQPLSEIATAVRALAPRALLHCDAVQAFSSLGPECYAAADLVSLSAHKFGGPPGAGLLVVREAARAALAPLLRGGPQEGELRAGTENLAAIVGMAAAARVVTARPAADRAALARRRDRLGEAVCAAVPGTLETGRGAERVPSICHLCFATAESEELLFLLDEAGVAASAGAACASGALEPSHVLLAMGRDDDAARRVLRLSLGPETTDEEVDFAAEVVSGAALRLSG